MAVVSEVNNVVVQLADDDVRALHGNLFCEQLPEEILTKFLATKCDLCLIDFTSPNGNITFEVCQSALSKLLEFKTVH